MEEQTMEMQGIKEIQEVQNKINIHLNLVANFDLFRSKVQQSIVTKLTEAIELYAAQLTTAYITEPETTGKVEQFTSKLENLSTEAENLKEYIKSLQNPTLKDLLKIGKITDKLEDLEKESELLSAPSLFFNQEELQKILHNSINLKEEGKVEEEKKEMQDNKEITEGEVQDDSDGYTGDMVMRLSRGSNLIYIYEFKSSKLLTCKLGSVKFEAKMASTQFKNTLFASGGVKSKNEVLKDFYSFNGEKKLLSKLKSMIYPRLMHCLVAVNLNYVFALGGLPRQMEVEFYQNGKWEQYPALNEGRCNFAACYLQNALYVFCGTSDQKGRLDTIQKSQIDKTPWIILKLQDNDYWKPQAWLSCVPLNPSEILIFRCDNDEINFIFEIESHNLRTYKAKGSFSETSGYWCASVKREDRVFVPNYALPLVIKSMRIGVKEGVWEKVSFQKG